MVFPAFPSGDLLTKQRALLDDKERALYSALPYSAFMNILGAILMVVIQWSVIPRTLLLSWATTVITISLLRYANYRLYVHRRTGIDHGHRWLVRNIAGVLATGAAWGSAAFVLFPPDNPPHQMAVILMLCGIAAGAMTTLSTCLVTIKAYLALTLIPLIVRLLSLNNETGWTLGSMVVIFLITILISSVKFNKNIRALFQARYRNEQARAQLKLAATAFEGDEGIFITDENSRIVKANQAVTRITGYEEQELLGKTPRIFSSGRQDKTFYSQMWQSIAEYGTWSGELWNRRKDGSVYPQRLTITAVKNEENNNIHYVGHFNDISKQKETELQIRYQAYYDALTDLPNRRLFQEQLQQRLSRMHRAGSFGVLLYIDLDRFKQINDIHGHHVGDGLLKIVAAKLRAQLRTEDTAARLGGDEFVALLGDLGTDVASATANAEKMLQRFLDTLSGDYTIDGKTIHCNLSIGAALLPSYQHSESELLIIADQAMYEAKKAGHNRFRLVDSDQPPAQEGHTESV